MNLLALRFANRIINSQWDNKCIDHIQITAAETVGIEGRWSYYDTVGQLRDMFQNHLLQLLCMVAMEPPNSLKAEEIRAEKIKLLRALRPIGSDKVDDYVVRGQYTNGWIDGKPVVGYLEEEGAENSNSNNETFVAIKVEIDNWRWAGVPFYMRTGKRLNAKHTEIIIAYKESSHSIIADKPLDSSNKLVIRLQPNEGIELEMISKKQSLKQRLSTEKRVLNLDFHDGDSDKRVVDAYERLFLELIKGDQWLFVSREEIETSWDWCDQIIDAWNKNKSPTRLYSAGSNLERVADARMAIEQARLLTLHAAWKIDNLGVKHAMTEISAIKVVVPNMLQSVVDMALQIHGGAGMCSDFPLARFAAGARALRLADGPDEVHKGMVSRLELKKYQ